MRRVIHNQNVIVMWYDKKDHITYYIDYYK